MSIRFTKLTRANIRKLLAKQTLLEHGIYFERLADGDGRYTVNIMVDAQRIHRVIGKESEGVTRKQAEDFIEKLRADARQGRLNLPQGRKVTLGFNQAAKKYLQMLKEEGGKDITTKIYRLNLHLVPFFKESPLSQINSFNVEHYKKHRLDAGAKPGTINRELATLSHLLNKAIEWKWINHKACSIKRLNEGNGRITYLTTDQIKRILEVAKQDQCHYIYPFIVIGLQTSMRRMEILSIKLEHINLERQIIYIPIAKGGAREQPATLYLVNFLKAYLKTVDPQQIWLFPSKLSKSGHVMNIEKQFRRVITSAGLNPKEVVRHTLRHTAITHLLQAGVDLPTVQRISGHKTLQMVVRYSHQNGEHIRTAMNALEHRYDLTESNIG